MSGFRPLGERLVHQGRVIRVVTGTFEAPDGSTFERDIVRSPGAVAVVALDTTGSATLVRQYRSALDDWLLELPAGLLDVDGEDPLACAQRELAEEVGLAAEHWERLCEFHNAAGQTDQQTIVFLAEGLTEVQPNPQSAEEHAMIVEHVPLADAVHLISDGVVRDAKTCIGLLLARDRLRG
ncbi:MAG: NUDIX domain-containing protein [Acidimicrobiales bacterium]